MLVIDLRLPLCLFIISCHIQAAFSIGRGYYSLYWLDVLWFCLHLLWSSGSWLLSGKLVKMLLLDSEQNDYDKPLTISGLSLNCILYFIISMVSFFSILRFLLYFIIWFWKLYVSFWAFLNVRWVVHPFFFSLSLSLLVLL